MHIAFFSLFLTQRDRQILDDPDTGGRKISKFEVNPMTQFVNRIAKQLPMSALKHITGFGYEWQFRTMLFAVSSL